LIRRAKERVVWETWIVDLGRRLSPEGRREARSGEIEVERNEFPIQQDREAELKLAEAVFRTVGSR